MIWAQFTHADAGGADHPAPRNLYIRLHHRLQKAVRHLPTPFQVTTFKKDAKLIPTEQRDKISGPTCRHHGIRHLNQQRVADIMAIGVIHGLEIIQIHIKQRVGFGAFRTVYPLHQIPTRLRRGQIIKINIARELGVRQPQPLNQAAHSPMLNATKVELVK